LSRLLNCSPLALRRLSMHSELRIRLWCSFWRARQRSPIVAFNDSKDVACGTAVRKFAREYFTRASTLPFVPFPRSAEHHSNGSALPVLVQSGNLSLEIWSSGILMEPVAP
jgi:hypothetical protein